MNTEFQNELTEVHELLSKAFSQVTCTLEFTQEKRGFCYYTGVTTRKITIPNWVWEHGWNYAVHYLLHEWTHAICGSLAAHNAYFKQKEIRLHKLFDLVISHRVRYLKELKTAAGELVMERKYYQESVDL